MTTPRERWEQNLPRLVEDAVAAWSLRLGAPYVSGAGGYTVRVERGDGSPAVLKVAVPHREAEREADALERWNGHGAVRLLARDDGRGALAARAL